MMENDQFLRLAMEFLRKYYAKRGIEDVESEALVNVRQRAEKVKQSFKTVRDSMDMGISESKLCPRRIHNNRRATAAAKVRDEVYKTELAGDIRKFESKCFRLKQELRCKRKLIHWMRQKNFALKARLKLLEQFKEEKTKTTVIVDTLGETYEERRRAGFVCPSLFGEAIDVVRYGGALPKSSQD